MSDDFLEIPSASGNEGGGAGGQGASQDGAPAPSQEPAMSPREQAMLDKIERLTSSVETLSRRQAVEQTDAGVRELKRQINAALGKQKAAIETAKTNLASAFDDGDGSTIAAAQAELSTEIAKNERMMAEGRAKVAEVEAEAKKASTPAPDTANLDKWKARNASWFGIDAGMTREAMQIGSSLEQAGQIETGSVSYYEAIDNEMRRRHPDRLKGSPGAAPIPSSAGGSPTGVTKIPREIADSWAAMGIDMSDPEVVARMVGRRQEAVDRGMLTEVPATGRVYTR